MAEKMENTVFVRRVKDLMKEQRYSQAKLCELCHITEAAFSRYMTTGRLPRTDIIANIANVLQTSVDNLLGVDANYNFKQIKALLANSRDSLSKNQKVELSNLLLDINKELEIGPATSD